MISFHGTDANTGKLRPNVPEPMGSQFFYRCKQLPICGKPVNLQSLTPPMEPPFHATRRTYPTSRGLLPKYSRWVQLEHWIPYPAWDIPNTPTQSNVVLPQWEQTTRFPPASKREWVGCAMDSTPALMPRLRALIVFPMLRTLPQPGSTVESAKPQGGVCIKSSVRFSNYRLAKATIRKGVNRGGVPEFRANPQMAQMIADSRKQLVSHLQK